MVAQNSNSKLQFHNDKRITEQNYAYAGLYKTAKECKCIFPVLSNTHSFSSEPTLSFMHLAMWCMKVPTKRK